MLTPELKEIVELVAVLVGAPGLSFLGGRYGLNGTRQKVASMAASQASMVANQAATARQVERIEGKVDQLGEGVADVRERLARVEAHEEPVAHRR